MPDSTSSNAAETPEQRLVDVEARLASMSDAYLRAKAEAENIRRRSDEEVGKARKFAIDGFAESLLPVRDSLEAALTLPNASNEQLLEGVNATLRQLAQALERNKVVPIAPLQAPGSTRISTRRSAWCLPSKRPTRW